MDRAAAGLTLSMGAFLAILAARFLYFLVARRAGWSRWSDPEIARRTEQALFGQDVKQAFAAALRPLVRIVERSGMHPHTLTVICAILSIVASVAIGLGQLLAGGLLAAVASLFDYLDGRVARSSGRTSIAGNFLDSTLDRVAEISLFAGAAMLFRDSALLLLSALVASAGAILTSYARAKAESLGLTLKSGWLQRPERMTLFCAGAVSDAAAEAWGWLPARESHAFFAAAIAVLAALGLVTTLQRLWAGATAASRQRNGRPTT